MRALAFAIGASLVANALAIVWLRPGVAVAAEIISEEDDSDVSPTTPDEDREVVVELLDEPVGADTQIDASMPAVGTTARTPRIVTTAATATRAPDSTSRTADSTASAVRASDSAVRASDSAVRASDSAVGGSDSSVGGSDGSAGAPNGAMYRTLDAILARPDASTGGELSDAGSQSKMMTMRGVDLALTTEAVDALLSRPRAPDASATKESPDPPDEAATLRHEITELDKRMMGPDLDKYASADEIEGLREDLESKKRDLAQMTIHPTAADATEPSTRPTVHRSSRTARRISRIDRTSSVMESS